MDLSRKRVLKLRLRTAYKQVEKAMLAMERVSEVDAEFTVDFEELETMTMGLEMTLNEMNLNNMEAE